MGKFLSEKREARPLHKPFFREDSPGYDKMQVFTLPLQRERRI
jgi:hypothetical protein